MTSGIERNEIIEEAVIIEEIVEEKSILDMEPSRLEVFWNVGLLVSAYVGMGAFLTIRLLMDIVNSII